MPLKTLSAHTSDSYKDQYYKYSQLRQNSKGPFIQRKRHKSTPSPSLSPFPPPTPSSFHFNSLTPTKSPGSGRVIKWINVPNQQPWFCFYQPVFVCPPQQPSVIALLKNAPTWLETIRGGHYFAKQPIFPLLLACPR